MNKLLKIFVLIFIGLNIQISFAESGICSALPKAIDLHPTVEAKFIGRTKSPLFSAPNRNCKLKKVYVPVNSYFPVYSYSEDWVYLMYTKGDEDFMGWLPIREVRIIAPYGSKP
jgi:hypothetical protein